MSLCIWLSMYVLYRWEPARYISRILFAFTFSPLHYFVLIAQVFPWSFLFLFFTFPPIYLPIFVFFRYKPPTSRGGEGEGEKCTFQYINPLSISKTAVKHLVLNSSGRISQLQGWLNNHSFHVLPSLSQNKIPAREKHYFQYMWNNYLLGIYVTCSCVNGQNINP